MNTENRKSVLQLITQYALIVPILFIINVIDSILGLFLPNKFYDNTLPPKDSTLSILTDPNDSKSAYRSTQSLGLIALDEKSTNLYDELNKANRLFFAKKIFGVREVFSIEEETQPNGKVFKKYSLGDYKWTTFEEVFAKVNNLSNGLLRLGLRSDQNVVLFAETRPEWMMSAFACFRVKCPVVTLYATLGVEALAYGINESKASLVITSSEQLPKFHKIVGKIATTLRHLVVFTDKFTMHNVAEFRALVAQSNLSVSVHTFEDVLEAGAKEPLVRDFTEPTKNDLAVIMYTSGSTGTPKGVMISHGNLLVAIKSFLTRIGKMGVSELVTDEDTYIAYLPLAHVLELTCELIGLFNGIPIGYSSPLTISDASTGIKKGQMGDLRMLKPTFMATIPIVLERVCKIVNERLGERGWLFQMIFARAYAQKLAAFKSNRGTHLLDAILFNRFSTAALGGRMRNILTGGALLSKEVQEFAQVCIAPTSQAYGLTETCGAGTTQLPNQTDTETVGSVVPCCEIRLVDWVEAGYRTTDKPNPRGEILIGGESITLGYYNMPEQTSKDFSYINGVRYFATGDIGEMLPGGHLRIIDRKKDLVKLAGGEYVSLNKMESIIKLVPLVDNICMVANSYKSYCVALVCPNLKQLKAFVQQEQPDHGLDMADNNDANGSDSEKILAEMCALCNRGEDMMKRFNAIIAEHCVKQGVDRMEIPSKCVLVKEVWLPETGLVTDSLKLKRKELEKFYSQELQAIYT